MRATVGEKFVNELPAANRHTPILTEPAAVLSRCPEISVGSLGSMDAAEALADLVEISPQIEAAAVVAPDGGLAGSVGIPEVHGTVLAGAVRQLIEGAAAFRKEGGHVTQVHAELADGDVFAVTGADQRTVVAVVRDRAAPGLVFYDLKRCLAATADEA
jgi:predicted regulator of Ras-like GTPase activity (Roadblock/LC7/MglB family)